MRIAIVGAGGIAQRNAREAKASGVASISSVFDVNSQAAVETAKALGSRCAETYEDILKDGETDAILLSVPHHLHCPMTLAAAQSGKHILVEKPLAISLKEAREMRRACEENGVKLTVNFSFRFLPVYRKAKDLVDAGALGEIAGIQLVVHQYKDRGYWSGARSNSPDDWRTSKEKSGGGYLIMNVCHIIDYIAYITGLKAQRVYAEYDTRSSPAEVEDIISASYRLENGAIGSVSASSIMRGMEQVEQRIWGTNGSMRLTGGSLEFYSTRPIDGKRPGRLHTLKKFPNVSWTAEWIKDFVNAVENDTEPGIGLKEGWENLAFVQSAYRSMETGTPSEIAEYLE